MQMHESIILSRTCDAIAIPSGHKVELFKGTHLTITQSLGGTFTVMTDQGMMASLDGTDADAIGKPIPPESLAPEASQSKPLDELVWEKLRTCYDPEIPHNIVDLGLIYNCDIAALEGGQHRVDVRMTLTAPGCGMGEWLKKDVENKLLALPGVKEARVEVVFDPPWNPSKMAPPLRRALNM